jgi:hypothetical protein
MITAVRQTVTRERRDGFRVPRIMVNVVLTLLRSVDQCDHRGYGRPSGKKGGRSTLLGVEVEEDDCAG